MSDIERDVSLGGLIFAEEATPTQGAPSGPTIGTPYRNETLTQQVNGQGWPFSKIVNSADFNEIMYRITSVLNSIEIQGILFWSEVTDYVEGSIVRRTSGSTERFFEALQPSGPNSGGFQDPAIPGTIGIFWKEASISGGNGGYTVQFVSSNASLEKGVLYFCTGGNITLILPTVAITNGDKLKIATGSAIGLNSIITITGAIEGPGGETDNTELIIDTPFSSVELVYNSISGLWKVCSPIASGIQLCSSVPAGTVLSYAVAVEPPGFLICDGRAISRTEYSTLFAVLGTTYGAGDGSTTFNIPDFRGRFLRGYGSFQDTFKTWRDGTEVTVTYTNSSNQLGVPQSDELPNIMGRIGIANPTRADGAFYSYSGQTGADLGELHNTYNLAVVDATKFNSIYGRKNGTDTAYNEHNINDPDECGGTHVVPANYAVYYIIKY